MAKFLRLIAAGLLAWTVTAAPVVAQPLTPGNVALYFSKRPTAAVVANTWDPANSSANWALTGGNLTATHSTTTNDTVRGTKSLTVATTPFFEATMTAGTITSIGIGLCDGSHVATSALGGDVHGFAYVSNGQVFINGSAVGNTGQTYVSGNKVGVKFVDATHIQVRVNGGSWSASFSIAGLGWTSGTSVYPCAGSAMNASTAVYDGTGWL